MEKIVRRRTAAMAETKYGHLNHELFFADQGLGPCQQKTMVSPETLGIDVYAEIGSYGTAGKMGKAPHESVIHDYNEVMIWLGADTSDLSELGAEIELCLGEEKERHMFASSSIVMIPKGTPHFPATITKMNKPFLFMRFSMTRELKSTPVLLDKKPGEIAGFHSSKYGRLISQMLFARKAAWHYGPMNPDDSGGSLCVFMGKEFDYAMFCESIRKAPYRFGPNPDEGHTHPYDEFGITIGSDIYDLNHMDAKIISAMGPEKETSILTKPSLAMLPRGVLHGPLAVLKIGMPLITVIVKPYGTGGHGI
jgi:hypothetical protein